MTKLTVWECDKCGIKVTTPLKPSYWVEAKIHESDNMIYNSEEDIKSYLWCGNCFREIKRVIPTIREG